MEMPSKTSRAATDKKSAGTHRKYRKRWGIQSCLSVFLAAVVTVTTIHSQVLFVQAENGVEEDTRTRFTFLEASSYQTDYQLGKKGTLAETLEQLPKSLPITILNADEDKEEPLPDVSGGNLTEDTEQNKDNEPPTENTGSENGKQETPDNSSGENDGVSPDENGENNGDASTDASPENGSAADSENTAGGETDSANISEDTSLQTTVSDVPIYSAPEETSAAVITSGDDSSDTPGDSAVKPGSGEDSSAPSTDSGSGADSSVPSTNPGSGEGSSVPSTDPDSGEDSSVPSTDPDSGEDSSVPPTEPAPEEDNTLKDAETDAAKNTILQAAESSQTESLPVSWSCDRYDEARDSYVFTPTWNSSLFDYAGAEEDIPTITVTFEDPFTVSNETELQQAFDNLLANPPADETPVSIVLANDISLSDTLYISTDWPKDIQITLESKMTDGSKGFSLTRGTVSDGTTFSGAMIRFGNYPTPGAAIPSPASAESSLALTLRNITIDGKKVADVGDDSSILSTDANRADAPAVISNGHLILESGARIINNYNGGTYLKDEGNAFVLDETGANVYEIPPCGGGLWVCGGTLELKNGCRIQYNTAELFGGGIYLGSGAVLRCLTEAEALTGNTANTKNTAAGNPGADLYACAGSTIYYDRTVFIPWSSFYLDEADLIPINGSEPDTTTPVEIYLHVCSDSGYTYEEVKEQIENAFGGRVTVLLPQSYMIDTTDLRNWYVYDHYDTNHWGGASIDGAPVSWQNAYREYKHRPYYGYTTRYARTTVKDNEISAWLENPPYETEYNVKYLALAPLKEHIYSRTENGRPEMSFVGYDSDPNVDFLFYDPESPGQKTVEFDVDSSKVNTHTLTGTGFLLDTGIVDDDFLSGYLLYYTYSGTSAKDVSLYKFDHISIDSLHSSTSSGISQITWTTGQTDGSSKLIGSAQQITDWKTEMSIKIKVEADKITLTQHPKNEPTTKDNTFTYTWPITSDTKLNGFGPLVAYSSHACYKASSFTYSNLRMQFTNPDDEKNLLSSLTEADFSQDGNVKRYFMNLLGESQTLNYGGNSGTGTELGNQYHEYLYMMQDEGIGLITDAETGFEEYLGPTKISQNLFEIPNPDKSADLNRLIANLQTYLSMYPTTELPQKENLVDLGLKPANITKPVGNIYLAGADNVQIERVINANTIASGYLVNVMDIACDPENESHTAKYYLRKPGDSTYWKLPLGTGTEDSEKEDSGTGSSGSESSGSENSGTESSGSESSGTENSGTESSGSEDTENHVVRSVQNIESPAARVSFHDARNAGNSAAQDTKGSITRFAPNVKGSVTRFSVPGRAADASFVITNDPIAWPSGLYTVKQEITDSSIYGYSYFTLTRDPLPVVTPGGSPEKNVGSSQSRPEIMALAGAPEVLPSDGASQPKTGDGMFPAMPVACGACTAFMLKIMLWMYDMDFEAITELKLDTVQSLISWGKGAAKPRIYLAIVALTVVITAYHILKALYENSRQFVRERLGKA